MFFFPVHKFHNKVTVPILRHLHPFSFLIVCIAVVVSLSSSLSSSVFLWRFTSPQVSLSLLPTQIFLSLPSPFISLLLLFLIRLTYVSLCSTYKNQPTKNNNLKFDCFFFLPEWIVRTVEIVKSEKKKRNGKKKIKK